MSSFRSSFNQVRSSSLLALSSLAMLGFSSQASAQDLVFNLINQSSYDVIEFYASPYNVDYWEDDILGSDILESGYSIRITIADARTQCEYDLRFVFDDGDVIERSGVDLCRTRKYTLTD
jgi:hypothetical protein